VPHAQGVGTKTTKLAGRVGSTGNLGMEGFLLISKARVTLGPAADLVIDQQPQELGFFPASATTDPIFAMASAIAFVELTVDWVSFK
jgi:hypothetical protein